MWMMLFLGVRIIVDIHTYSGKKGEKGDVQNGSDRPTDRFHAYGPIWGIRTMGDLGGFPHDRAGQCTHASVVEE